MHDQPTWVHSISESRPAGNLVLENLWPRLMEFVEGASRLKGGAKALDIWRIETKIEANCVDSSWKFMESIHFDTSFLGPQNFELTSKSCLWIRVSKKTAYKNDFA